VPTLEDLRPLPAPLLYAVTIFRGQLLSEKTAVKCTLICGPGPTHRIMSQPAHSQILLSWLGLHINSTAGHGLKHFFFKRTLIFKIVALKRLIRKILKTVAAHI
jgi:hypothetical protein